MPDILDAVMEYAPAQSSLLRLATEMDQVFERIALFNAARRRARRIEMLQRCYEDNSKIASYRVRLGKELTRGSAAMRAVKNRLQSMTGVLAAAMQGDGAAELDKWLTELWRSDSPYREQLEVTLDEYGFSRPEMDWFRKDMAQGDFRLCSVLFPEGAIDMQLLLHAVCNGERTASNGGFLELPEDPVEAARVKALVARARTANLTASVYTVILIAMALPLAALEQAVQSGRMGEKETYALGSAGWLQAWSQKGFISIPEC